MIRMITVLVPLALVAGNILATSSMTYISHINYPGGDALSRLHSVVRASTGRSSIDLPILRCSTTPSLASVFIDNLAAQTGASIFLQECSLPIGRFGTSPPLQGCEWSYHKNETSSTSFTHGILEPQEISEDKGGRSRSLASISAFDGVRFIKRDQSRGLSRWIPSIETEDVLQIVEY